MKSPHGLALDPKARRAYSAGRNGKLVVLDLATGKVVKALDVTTSVDPSGYDPGLGRVYLPGGGKLTVISTATNSVIGEIALSKGARNICVDPTTHIRLDGPERRGGLAPHGLPGGALKSARCPR